MIVVTTYEVDSWLSRRNPTVKLAAHLLVTLAMTVVFDPLTPLAFLVVALLVGRTLGRIPLAVQVTALLPVWLLAASLVVTNALFANDTVGTTVWWRWGPFTATVEGARIGLSLAERGVAVAAFTLLVVLSTDPADLVRSLVQQARIPARMAYAGLAAYRFLPLLRDEMEAIRLAQRIRGMGRRPGPAGWLAEQRRLLVPLFANAIRKAERLALAMDSRGFGSEGRRTHYRRVALGWRDALLFTGVLGMTVAIFVVSAATGTLRLWTGAFSA